MTSEAELVDELYELFEQLIPKSKIRKGIKLCKEKLKRRIQSP